MGFRTCALPFGQRWGAGDLFPFSTHLLSVYRNFKSPPVPPLRIPSIDPLLQHNWLGPRPPLCSDTRRRALRHTHFINVPSVSLSRESPGHERYTEVYSLTLRAGRCALALCLGSFVPRLRSARALSRVLHRPSFIIAPHVSASGELGLAT